MSQFQLAFDFSAPAEPVLLGLDAETVQALANDALPEISIPEIIAGITEPEQPPISEKPKCQILVVPEREAPKGFNRDYRITDADEIGAGGLKAKFENNLAAIRLLKQLEQENRTEATPEEKRTLVRYCGWGALAQKAFSYNYEFYDLQRELQELLTEEEHTQASASSVNAHCTSPMVINAIWRAARRLGIRAQSRILEPAAGIGHFLGLQPEELKSNSRVAVEIDATSAAILRLLYPDTTVRACGFQQPGLPLNFFDLAISNVPFGKYGVHDTQFKSKPRLCSAIHDYFFAKALAHIRPGGLLAFITSRYTLDKKDEYLRRHLDEHVVFLGAIRHSDRPEEGLCVNCYAYEEAFGEKLRALGERTRPRDLYDVVNLYRHAGTRPSASVLRNVLEQKCAYKAIAVPTVEALAPHRADLEAMWQNMLAHQLPILPPPADFWNALPEIFAWIMGAAEVPERAHIQHGSGEIAVRSRILPMGVAPRARMTLEIIRFAAANHLCVDLTYDGGVRRIEPYSLRQTIEGNFVLHAVRSDSGDHRSYRVDRMQSASATAQTFSPRYLVEITSTGPLPFTPAAPSSLVERRPAMSKSRSPVYIYRCMVCRKTFKRKSMDGSLNPHKHPQGYPCPGRAGVYVHTEH